MRLKINTPIGLTLMLGTIFLTGCGGGGNTSNSAPSTDYCLDVLTINKTCEVQSGDTIIPSSNQTRILVQHHYNDNSRYVTLLSGSASLIKNALKE